MADRTAVVTMSFEGNTAGEMVTAPEETLAPYVNGGYMAWVATEPAELAEEAQTEPAESAVEAPEAKKATRGKAGA